MKSNSSFKRSVRDAFFDALYRIFLKDPKTVLISADNGAPSMDPISELPNQFRNVGIAEHQMIGMACGLALEGRHVWVYAIDPFATVRCLEFIKVDMCAMNLPVVSLGVGAGYSYDIMGPTHHGVGDLAVMRPWPNLTIFSPSDVSTATALAQLSYEHKGPQYIRFDRAAPADLHDQKTLDDFRKGLLEVRPGNDLCIISAGRMVHEALRVAEDLEKEGLNAAVVDLFRLKPVNTELLLPYLYRHNFVVTYEEEYLACGLGSIIAEILVDIHRPLKLLRIGQGDRFVFDLGGREVIWKKYGLDKDTVVKRILNWYL